MILVDNRNVTNPYLNLALEEYLLRNLQCGERDYLLLYINEPSIVVGKNQSVYKEVNFEYLRNGQLKLARRITGGGTVYHDGGNLNFSIISKFENSKINNYKYFNQQIIDALGRAGVPAEMDSRNSILSSAKKISGSAQFTNRKNMISHGTLLFNADLNVLRASLKPNDFKIETKAVSSVNKSVINIAELTNRFTTILELKQFLIAELGADKNYALSAEQWAEVEKLRTDKFQSFEWIYGRSPLTRIEKEGSVIEVDNGKIVTLNATLPNVPDLEGVDYEYNTLKKRLANSPDGADILNCIF